ncbi:MFS general substrate transporter [Annulohypoxylon moriforme]|nr:MFS general substrate transporter [Annulohypoxylon moriforme]
MSSEVENEKPLGGESSSPRGQESTNHNDDDPSTSPTRGWRFWGALSAIESTVTSTALPFIVHELDAGGLYVWFVNAYFLTSTAFLPPLGQMCDLFGRRWMMITVVALFALGSGIAGGANSAAVMIAGHAVQGIGGGGINLLIELIVSDLIPLRQRGAYMGIIFGVFSLGTAVGPLVGGTIVDGITWRWVFYINLPVAGTALILHILFLRVNYDRETSIIERLKKIDYAGNAILVGSVVSAFSDEGMPWVKDYPTLPERVFKRRTPAAALLIAFINFIALFWIIYFLPIYFQAVLGMSPTILGVALLPTCLLSAVMSAISGIILTKTGRYRPLRFIAFALITLGLGLFSRFNQYTSTAEWVVVQITPAFGLGIMMSTNLPAVQADLPESDTASATGISIPAAIFNAKFASESWRIDDPQIENQLSGGNAYSYANADFVRGFPEPQRDRVIDVYARSLQLTWQVSLGFALLGLLLCFLEKEIVLRTNLETEFGLEEKKAGDVGDVASRSLGVEVRLT